MRFTRNWYNTHLNTDEETTDRTENAQQKRFTLRHNKESEEILDANIPHSPTPPAPDMLISFGCLQGLYLNGIGTAHVRWIICSCAWNFAGKEFETRCAKTSCNASAASMGHTSDSPLVGRFPWEMLNHIHACDYQRYLNHNFFTIQTVDSPHLLMYTWFNISHRKRLIREQINMPYVEPNIFRNADI